MDWAWGCNSPQLRKTRAVYWRIALASWGVFVFLNGALGFGNHPGLVPIAIPPLKADRGQWPLRGCPRDPPKQTAPYGRRCVRSCREKPAQTGPAASASGGRIGRMAIKASGPVLCTTRAANIKAPRARHSAAQTAACCSRPTCEFRLLAAAPEPGPVQL